MVIPFCLASQCMLNEGEKKKNVGCSYPTYCCCNGISQELPLACSLGKDATTFTGAIVFGGFGVWNWLIFSQLLSIILWQVNKTGAGAAPMEWNGTCNLNSEVCGCCLAPRITEMEICLCGWDTN